MQTVSSQPCHRKVWTGQAATTGMLHILQPLLPPGQPGHRGEAKRKKPALFLILATTRKAWPAVSRLARRDGTVGARRGHLSSSKREMRGPARAGPAAPATPTRGCASGSGCCSQGWLRGLSSLLFLPRGFLQSPRHKELRLLHHTGP